MPKKIDKQKFIELSKIRTRNAVARHFGIADMTAQRLADELGITFKKFIPAPTGRKKIKFQE